ncbi:hypothetical protein HF998_06840, partial [Cellulomonas hominis]|nr:hypothetical protein [Cellulomonas hominis]
MSGPEQGAFDAGDAVVMRRITDPSQLRVGQVATFWPARSDQLVTHRIIALKNLPVMRQDESTGRMVQERDPRSGEPITRPYIYTKGDANAEPDPDAPGGERERVLVDPVAIDPAGTTTLDAWQPSKEGELLAYQVSHGGTEESVLHVLDVATGEPVDGPVDRARYSPVAWEPGGRAFFYVRRLAPGLLPEDERQYHRRVWRHVVGTDAAEDLEVFGAGLDMTNYYGVSVSRDGRWLLVDASAGTAPRTDVWIADLAATEPGTVPAFREVAVGYDAEIGAWVGRDGRLYLHTTLDADRGRLAVADPEEPGVPHWRTLLPEDPEAVLEDVAVVDGGGDATTPLRLLAAWRRHAVSEVTAHDPATGERLPGEAGTVALPGLGSVGGLVTRPDGGPDVWFTYTDHTTVTQVHRYDAGTGATTLWAAPPG